MFFKGKSQSKLTLKKFARFAYKLFIKKIMISKVRGWSLHSKLDSREIHWFLELDLEPRISERFANKRKSNPPPANCTNLDPGLIFFLYWQIAQRFAVQDQAQGTNGCRLNPILNTETSALH